MALYFDDLEVGQTFESAGRTITNHDVMTFAGLSGDNNELHTNDEYARNSPFGQRIAHGLLVVAITTGLTSGWVCSRSAPWPCWICNGNSRDRCSSTTPFAFASPSTT